MPASGGTGLEDINGILGILSFHLQFCFSILPHFPLQQVSFFPNRYFILPPHLGIEIQGRALISQVWEELYA